MPTSRDGFAKNQDALISIGNGGILDDIKAFFGSSRIHVEAGGLEGSSRKSSDLEHYNFMILLYDLNY